MKHYVNSLFLVLLASLGSAVEVSVSCPGQVEVQEEFSCVLQVQDYSGPYDLKAVLEKDGSSAARVWNEDSQTWKSSYYYLKGYISKEGELDVRLKVEKEGEYEASFKLRKGSSTFLFPFTLSVEGSGTLPPSKEKEETESKNRSKKKDWLTQKKLEQQEESTQKPMPLTNEVILLEESSIETSGELVYLSKSQRMLEYAPYAFCLFLLGVIILLLKERF